MKKFLKVLIVFSLMAHAAILCAYDVVKRYTLLEDKFKTEDMLRPLGHDWLIDTTAAANRNLLDVIDEADAASKKNIDNDKISSSVEMLNKYKDTEQTLRAQVKVGIPLFSFYAGDVKIVPDIRFGLNWGANLGIRTEPFNLNSLMEMVGIAGVTPNMKQAVTNYYQSVPCLYNSNDIILSDAVCNTLPTQAEKDACKAIPDREKYRFPTFPNSVPDILAYTKLDAKGGLLFNYFVDNWFGHLDVYALQRSDYFIRLNANSLAAGSKPVANSKKMNGQLFLEADYKLGYRYRRYTIYGVVEELKLSTLQEQEANTPLFRYGTDPLFRIHADAKYQLPVVSFIPFVGAHKRSAYSAFQGLYGGAEIGAYAWDDRLGLLFRGMVDSEHITLTPRVRLWFMQLEYSLKMPIQQKVEDVTVSTLHSVDFRIFF